MPAGRLPDHLVYFLQHAAGGDWFLGGRFILTADQFLIVIVQINAVNGIVVVSGNGINRYIVLAVRINFSAGPAWVGLYGNNCLNIIFHNGRVIDKYLFIIGRLSDIVPILCRYGRDCKK